jgi:hypothetical protein
LGVGEERVNKRNITEKYNNHVHIKIINPKLQKLPKCFIGVSNLTTPSVTIGSGVAEIND